MKKNSIIVNFVSSRLRYLPVYEGKGVKLYPVIKTVEVI